MNTEKKYRSEEELELLYQYMERQKQMIPIKRTLLVLFFIQTLILTIIYIANYAPVFKLLCVTFSSCDLETLCTVQDQVDKICRPIN